MDEGKKVTLTRQELYDRIWVKPASKVAQELGISDVDMIVLCRNNQVPKPPKGYWSMVAYGRQVDRPPLPPLPEGATEIIEIEPGRSPAQKAATPAAKPTAGVTAKPAEPPIPVSDTLRSPHPLVERTNLALRDVEAGYDGFVHPKWDKCLDVTVSRQQVGRAMRILDALFKAAEARGMSVHVEKKEHGNRTLTYLRVGEVDLRIRLSEMQGKFPKKLSAADRNRYEGYSPSMRDDYLYEKRPRGELSFGLEGSFAVNRNWYEKDGKRLEDWLPSILSSAERMAERVRKEEAEAKEWQRKWKLEEEQRQADARRREEERIKGERIWAQAQAWQKASLIRAYIAAARARAAALPPNAELDGWIAWADRFANALDPLRDPIEQVPQRCDPFSGSGTTAFVAKALNRHFIGIDNSERYVEASRRRLAKLDGLAYAEKVKLVNRWIVPKGMRTDGFGPSVQKSKRRKAA